MSPATLSSSGGQPEVLSPDVVAALGSDESEIIRAICQGFGDVESIHLITGIPVPCIQRKIDALLAMGLVTGVDGAFKPAEGTPEAALVAGRYDLEASAGAPVDGKRRILVVDDEPDIRLFLRLFLEKHGYAVLEASNGQNALELLESQGKHTVHCIITDYLMPRMNGLQLCDELRKDGNGRFIIFLMTAYLDKARFDTVRCFDEKFMKPLDFGDLVSRLSMHVT